MQRLVSFQHLAQREIEAGWQPPVVKFHDFLNALATLLWLYLLLPVRLGGWETERPEAWRVGGFDSDSKEIRQGGFSFNEIHQSVARNIKILHPCFSVRCQT